MAVATFATMARFRRRRDQPRTDPLGVDGRYRRAYDLGEIATAHELLAMIDDCPPGHLTPMQVAGRTLVRARLGDRDGYAPAREESAPGRDR